MDDKQAAAILMRLLDKHSLDGEESEAVRMAIGLFGWTSLSKSRIEKHKTKKAGDAKWIAG